MRSVVEVESWFVTTVWRSVKLRVDETQLKHYDAGRLSSHTETDMACFCPFETSDKLPEAHAHDIEVEFLVHDLNPTLPASFYGRIG
jgi:hypothetical protein